MIKLVYYILIGLILASCNGNEEKVILVDSAQEESNVFQDSTFWTIELPKYGGYIIAPPIGQDDLNYENKEDIFLDYVDLNSDNQEDIILNLGWKGQGGSLYAIFFKEKENLYSKVFEDYLKNEEFTFDKDGIAIILSFEEIKPGAPDTSYNTIYKFNKDKHQYEHDTTIPVYFNSTD